MAIAWWSIGNDALLHSCTCIMVTWSTLKIFKGSMPSTIFMYIFHMAYLGGGYYFKQTTGYDINWTMPGCVLCLRLIGNVQLFVNLTFSFCTLGGASKVFVYKQSSLRSQFAKKSDFYRFSTSILHRRSSLRSQKI